MPPSTPGPEERRALADDAAAVALGAAACIDVWMGGDKSWRARDGDGPSQEFMAGADWLMAEALTKAVLKAVVPAGTMLLAPGHVQVPRNAEEAKAMWLTGERWMRDRALEALRTPDPSPGGDRGGGEAMREACARWHEADAERHYAIARKHPLGSVERIFGAALGAEHEASAKAIRSLPTPATGPGPEERT